MDKVWDGSIDVTGTWFHEGVHIDLDPTQYEAQQAFLDNNTPIVVIGAPGTGKTRLITACALAALRQGVAPEKVLVLTASRESAGRLRNVITQQANTAIRGTIARTAPALAFSILSSYAAAQRRPAPRLITGPEQDTILATILQGHADGLVPAAGWPASIPEDAVTLRGFRDELRDLFMRVSEHGLTASELREMGKRNQRQEWVAAATILEEYQWVTRLSAATPDIGERYDPAGIVAAGAHTLATWDGPNRPTFDAVLVDDYHEATAATVALVSQLHADGAKILLAGDPDLTGQGFRGASPRYLAHSTTTDNSPGSFGATRIILPTVWRGNTELRTAVTRVTQSIASAGVVAHRTAQTADAPQPLSASQDNPAVRGCVIPSRHVEEAFIARTLRAWHLYDHKAWADMAIIARSAGELHRLRRALDAASIPVAVLGTDVALRDEPAVRALLDVIYTAAGEELTIDRALSLITSVYTGADSIQLRRLRRALRADELTEGGERTSDELILEVLNNAHTMAPQTAPTRLGNLRHNRELAPLGIISTMIAAARQAMDIEHSDAQTVLWATWDAAAVADTWRAIALSDSPAAPRAHQDLDAVMALFRAAETHVDRMPDARIVPFATFIDSQDLPADSLAIRQNPRDVVSLVTPQGAAGREWDNVIVTALQDGTWPNLTLRDTLLGSLHLVDVLNGRDGTTDLSTARRDVLYDELRSFTAAISRAKSTLVLTAVHDDTIMPSPFLHLVDPEPDTPDLTQAGAPLDTRGLVTMIRSELYDALSSDNTEKAHQAAHLLARLNTRKAGAANPATWYQAHAISTEEDLFVSHDLVPVSPSRVDAAATCSLRWALETSGGQPASGLSQNIGNIIHDIAAHAPWGTHQEYREMLNERWSQLRLTDGWPARRLRAHAEHMLEKLAAYTQKTRHDVTKILVEHPFDLTIAGARLRGSIDRVEILHDGRARIVDLKTGTSVPSQQDTEANPQLGIYQLAILNGAVPEVTTTSGAHLLYIANNTKTPSLRNQAPVDNPDDNWATELIADTVTTLRSHEFTAQRNTMCDHCPVRFTCPLRPEGRHLT